jgi:cell wall-associated NlpC family hydrolase
VGADRAALGQIESRLAAQRRYLKHLGRKLRRAVIEERRRQERLRRQAMLRRLAAERAARARAAARASMSWAGGSGGPGAATGAAARAVSFARAQLGKPYVWGASGPSSYDCSGLTMAAYRSAGVWLPRMSRAQWAPARTSAWAASPPETSCSSPATPATRALSTTSACTSAAAP